MHPFHLKRDWFYILYPWTHEFVEACVTIDDTAVGFKIPRLQTLHALAVQSTGGLLLKRFVAQLVREAQVARGMRGRGQAAVREAQADERVAGRGLVVVVHDPGTARRLQQQRLVVDGGRGNGPAQRHRPLLAALLPPSTPTVLVFVDAQGHGSSFQSLFQSSTVLPDSRVFVHLKKRNISLTRDKR